jgi:hypothetical protein
MALNKQLVPIILNQGLDTKTDEKLVVPGKLLDCNNALMQQNGALKLRTGYSADPATISDITFAANTTNAVLLGSNNGIYSHQADSDQYLGEFIPFSVVKSPIVNTINAQRNGDIAFNNQYEIAVWEDSSGLVQYSVYDRIINSFIVRGVDIDTGSHPRVAVAGNIALITYTDAASTLYSTTINLLDPTVIGAYINVSGTGLFDATANRMDVIALGSNFVISHTVKTSNNVKLSLVSSNGEMGNGLNGLPSPITISVAATTVTICQTPDVLQADTFALFYSTATPHLYYSQYDMGLRVITAEVDTVSLNATAMGAVFHTDDNLIYLHTYTSTTSTIYSVSLAGTSTVISTNMFNLKMHTKPFIYGNIPCFVHYYTSNDGLQDTAIFSTPTGKPFAVINDVVFNTVTGKIQNGSSIIAATTKARALSEDGIGLFYQTAISKLTVESVPVQAKSSGELTLLSGGFLKQFDGVAITEAQFLFCPEQPTVGTTTGGNIPDGSYSYITTWEWIDNNGNRMQSLSSIPKVYAKSTSGDASITVTCKKLPATLIPNTATNFPIFCVYRTTAGGTIYYKVSSDSSPVSANPTGAATVTFTDTLADASIISRELLYTTGGILDNDNVGRVDAICFGKQRAFFAGLDKPDEVKYSKLIRDGFSVSGSDALVIPNRVPKELGRITAIEELDDKIVLFYERGIYVIVGDGPTDAGQGGLFSDPQYLSSDVGCADARSLIRSQLGLMFKSEKGIWLLDRSLSLSYIGAEVEKYNDEVITGAAVIPNNNQIRFTTESGVVLSYDYYWKQWYTATTFPSINSFVRNTEHYIVGTGGVWTSNDTFLDDINPIQFRIATSWLSLSGLAGYERLYRLQLLGNMKDPVRLKVSFFYDFREYAEEVMYWDSNTGSVAFGEDAFGEGNFGGDNDGVFRVELRPARQKCTSVKMVIENIPIDNSLLAGFELSSLSLQVGMKQGLGKMRVNKYATAR